MYLFTSLWLYILYILLARVKVFIYFNAILCSPFIIEMLLIVLLVIKSIRQRDRTIVIYNLIKRTLV